MGGDGEEPLTEIIKDAIAAIASRPAAAAGEARLAASPLQRKLAEAAAEGMRMLSAHDCTLGWPLVKGGK